MKGLFIDFYDSFSQNIIDEFNDQNLIIDSIFWDDKFLSEKINKKIYSFIALGPGPGHVSDYKEIYDLIESILRSDKQVIGFCLGHQLIANVLGYPLVQLDRPLHGKSLPVAFTNQFLDKEAIKKVQFYNSWYVDVGEDKNKNFLVTDINSKRILCGLRGRNHLSYQFHPESVGTSCPSDFFSFIKEFLYNKSDVRTQTKI